MTGPTQKVRNVRLHSKLDQKSSKCQNLLTGWHLDFFVKKLTLYENEVNCCTWKSLAAKLLYRQQPCMQNGQQQKITSELPPKTFADIPFIYT